MKKKLIEKLLIAVLTGFMLFVFDINSSVEATSVKESNQSSVVDPNFYTDESFELEETEEAEEVEEKIMKYDAITGETTEVSLEELKKVNELLSNMDEENDTRLESYDPYKTIYTPFASTFSIRTKISDTTVFPYRATCKLLFNKMDGTTHGGSGVLVGDNLLLTAAHCVFDEDNNNVKFFNWLAYPAYNNGVYNNLSCGWSQVYYSDLWQSEHSYKYDWALCVLGENLGASTGYLGGQVYGVSSEMVGLNVTTLGYPINGDTTNAALYQYKTTGTISSCDTDWFKFTGVISGGMSGGPIIRSSDNLIVGVTSEGYTYQDAGKGWRLTQTVLNLIRELRG